jgi:6-phospho-beta-glucosidase
MKVAIVGGAGVRVPLLSRALAEAQLGVDEIALFDTDTARLRPIADLSRRAAAGVKVTTSGQPEPCLEGAGFVITSIRVGGARRRADDEALAMSHGVVAQETVGAVGFAMALRTIPPMVDYARLVARLAPAAWLITFTNPVSVVTQAISRETGTRAIGICDTPYEIFEDAAHALGVPATECAYDYFGLNHLGWLREVFHDGVPQMHRLWEDDARLSAVYRDKLFDLAWLRELRLLPSEYLYYYYRPEIAVEHQQRAGTSRGLHVAALTDALFADLAAGVHDPLRRYEAYLAARDASYMQIETGSTTPRVKPAWA